MFENMRHAADLMGSTLQNAFGEVAAYAPRAGEAVDDVLAVARAMEALIAAAAAVRTAAIAQTVRFDELQLDGRVLPRILPAGQVAAFAPDLVAAELGWGPYAADRRVGTATRMATGFPGVLAAMASGTVSMERAEKVEQATRDLDIDGRRAVDDVLAPVLGGLEPDRVTATVNRTVDRVAPQQRARSTKSRADRSVEVRDPADGSGLSLLSAWLPTEQASLIWNAVSSMAVERLGGCAAGGIDSVPGSGAAPGVAGGAGTTAARMPSGTSPSAPAGHLDDVTDEAGAPLTLGNARADALCDLLLVSVSEVSAHVTLGLSVVADPSVRTCPAGGGIPELASLPPDDSDRRLAEHDWWVRHENGGAVQQGAVWGAPGLHVGPVEVPGVGTIPAGVVAALLGGADARVSRALLDADTGALLEHRSDAYVPPRRIRDFITTRDQRCRFPGCTRPAVPDPLDLMADGSQGGLGLRDASGSSGSRVVSGGSGSLGSSQARPRRRPRADLDHTQPWPSGDTTPANLACLCRRHHRLKQDPRWTLRLSRDGVAVWTTPTGTEVSTRPDPMIFRSLDPQVSTPCQLPVRPEPAGASRSASSLATVTPPASRSASALATVTRPASRSALAAEDDLPF